MKRLLFPASALVLVLTACGAGAQPAPKASGDPRNASPPSVKAVAAAREREAERKAEQLLGRIVLPPGSRPVAHAPAALSHANLGVSVITEFAYRHRFWRVREPVAAVVAFMKHHLLPGYELGVSGGHPESLGFDRKPRGGHPLQRLLDVEMVSSRGWTFVRIDAGAAWIYPRSPEEVIPDGVTTIDVRGAGVSWHVADPAQVERIVAWFDALNVSSPGAHVIGCALELSSPVRFEFLSAANQRLAGAVVPSEPADGCNPISFTIGAKAQEPLIDARFGRFAFVNRVQRLLGVCFRDPRRSCR